MNILACCLRRITGSIIGGYGSSLIDQGLRARNLFGGMIFDTKVLERRSCCCSWREEAFFKPGGGGKTVCVGGMLLVETRAQSGVVKWRRYMSLETRDRSFASLWRRLRAICCLG